MSDVAPKANRRWIVVPWAIFILAVAGWSAWWMVSAREVGNRMDEQAKSLREKGYAVSWKMRSIGGYPFRYFVQLREAQIGAPDGWGLSAPKLDAETSALTPGIVVLVAPQGLTLSRPGKPALTVTGEVLRMSLGGLDRTPPRISIEGKGLRLAAAGGGEITFPAIDRFEARLAPADAGKASLFFRIDKATPRADSLLARVAGAAAVTVDVEGTLSQASGLTGTGPDSALVNWLTAGGKFEVTQGGMALGETPLFSLKPSAVGADQDGRLTGKLRLSTGRAGEAMVALGEISVLPPETAAVASGIGDGSQVLTALIGEASISLQFHDGQAWAGPLALGPAPRVFTPPEPTAPE